PSWLVQHLRDRAHAATSTRAILRLPLESKVRSPTRGCRFMLWRIVPIQERRRRSVLPERRLVGTLTRHHVLTALGFSSAPVLRRRPRAPFGPVPTPPESWPF